MYRPLCMNELQFTLLGSVEAGFPAPETSTSFFTPPSPASLIRCFPFKAWIPPLTKEYKFTVVASLLLCCSVLNIPAGEAVILT